MRAALACVSLRARITPAIRSASPALARRSSGFGNPRSAKTFPLPSSTAIDLAMLLRSFTPLQPFSMFLLGSLEPRLDQVSLSFWRFDPGLRLLLERMEHIDAASQPHGIDGTICISAMILDDF